MGDGTERATVRAANEQSRNESKASRKSRSSAIASQMFSDQLTCGAARFSGSTATRGIVPDQNAEEPTPVMCCTLVCTPRPLPLLRPKLFHGACSARCPRSAGSVGIERGLQIL
eukprot:scaffold68193_cov33-Tisochrysis_lutea.AAC.2